MKSINLYFTDAIGYIRPGLALIKATSVADAESKIFKYIEEYPHFQLFKTNMIGTHYHIKLTHATNLNPDRSLLEQSDIKLFDTGGINEEPDIAPGVCI